jgi:bifunctional enzyme Fae/Hps
MLDKKTHYLQIALNSTLDDARNIIFDLPSDKRIILEAGTPLIKRYGMDAIRFIIQCWNEHFLDGSSYPYIVADMKCQDRGATEVSMVKNAGASAITVNGTSPIETINSFISECEACGLDSMIDMMNVDQPIKVLRNLTKLPDVVILHRGVDEETFNKSKPIPYQQITKIRASYDVLISIAGGDTIREVQRAIFNDANIVVVWKEFYTSTIDTGQLAKDFLKQIK